MEQSEQTKFCKKCEQEKPVSDFLRVKGKPYGKCKSCRTEHNKLSRERRSAWYQANRPKLSQLQKEYVAANKEKITQYKAEWHRRNKERSNIKSRQNYENSDKDQVRCAFFQRKYGITLKQRNDLLETQGGGCAICGAVLDSRGKELSIDHCHESGIVRGILCNLCNSGIGLLGDNSILVEKALTYLKTAEKNINDIVNQVKLSEQTKEIND